MKKLALVFILIIIIAVVVTLFILSKGDKIKQNNIVETENKNTGGLILTSSAFKDGQSIPSKYTCDGEDINPPLEISGVSINAKSLALIMDDPDAPVGVWTHWVKWNIPANTTSIPEGQEPQGVSGKGTGENLSYKGPCPPDKEHRYFFKLYALDAILNLQEGADKKELEETMKGHILQQAELMGLYNRK